MTRTPRIFQHIVLLLFALYALMPVYLVVLASIRSVIIVTQAAPLSDVRITAPTGSHKRYVRPGTSVIFRLQATDEASALRHHDADAFVSYIANHIEAKASLICAPGDGVDQALSRKSIEAIVTITPALVHGGAPSVELALPVPQETHLGSILVFHSLELAGGSLSASGALALPASYKVVSSVGMRAPLVIPEMCTSSNQTPIVTRYVHLAINYCLQYWTM